MLLHLHAVLDADELARARALLAGASWGDGRVTAGVQSALAKNNEQLPQEGEAAKALQRIVLAALNRHHQFFSAALPRRILPPLFNRYSGRTNAFGDHVDNAVRFVPGSGERVRSDISCTLFLADPGEYDGGELVIEDTFGGRSVKLPAGDMLLYPGTSVHRVEPVTRGARVASFFWVESMVRSVEQRRLLFEMDGHLMRLRSSIGEADPAVIGLTGTYHNLLRLWAEV
jgi:PKHD-type hydroxylase